MFCGANGRTVDFSVNKCNISKQIFRPSLTSFIMQSASDVISSLFWFKDEGVEDEKKSDIVIIEQFVQHVEDFSSQYGSEISVSYTAFNLRGPPSNFPDYGDYPQAFVMVSDFSLVLL